MSEHQHPHQHEHDGRDHDGRDHGHRHEDDGHHRHGHHGEGFDWDAMAERLELDAAITAPIAHDVIAEVSAATDRPVTTVLDVGCGPGAVACTLAECFPDATVIAMDSTPELLLRVRRRADEAGVGNRVTTVDGDLDHPLPDLPPVDLVWAGMVLHHVADPVATLRRLHDVLAPGGTLVMTEFGDVPTALPEGDPLLADGTWSRFQAATTAALNERLGLDPVAIDWPALLAAAGFHDVRDAGRTAVHPAPLSPVAVAWLEPHIRRGVEMAGGRITADDAAALGALADVVASRRDLTVVASRRVLVARR